MINASRALALLGCLALAAACSSEGAGQEGGSRGGPGAGRFPGKSGAGQGGGFGAERPAAAVPVEVAAASRQSIASWIESNCTLEAENEVDLVARISSPVVELNVEEGMKVARGDLLARLDDRELRAAAEISRVSLEEARMAWERAGKLREGDLISPEAWDAAVSRYETARAQHEADRIQLGYTEIRAPFDALVVTRYITLAEHISVNDPLFRISDFEPLLCPVQLPEKDLPGLRPGQNAYVTLAAWPGRRFDARVQRIRPVVDAATGTVRVTLEVRTEGDLRPGMFGRVFVEMDRREDAVVIPKAALSLDSIGDTVYVARDGTAARRDVKLGFRDGEKVEVLSGLEEGEQVVVVGQDGLSDGTPIQVLERGQGVAGGAPPGAAPGARREAGGGDATGAREAAGPGGGPGGEAAAKGGREGPGSFDPANLTPEMIERIKERMRARGLTEEQIEERLRMMRARAGE